MVDADQLLIFCAEKHRYFWWWMDGWMDWWIDGLMDGWMDGCLDGWMEVGSWKLHGMITKQSNINLTCVDTCVMHAYETSQGGGHPFFSSIPLFRFAPWQPATPLVFSHRILERRDIPTHRDSAGRVHLRPPPPKWADCFFCFFCFFCFLCLLLLLLLLASSASSASPCACFFLLVFSTLCLLLWFCFFCLLLLLPSSACFFCLLLLLLSSASSASSPSSGFSLCLFACFFCFLLASFWAADNTKKGEQERKKHKRKWEQVGARHHTHTGWNFPRLHCLHGWSTWRDWHWSQPFTKIKITGTGMPGETPLPVALCDPIVLLSAKCFSALLKSLSALPRAFQRCAFQHLLRHEDLEVLEDGRFLKRSWKVPDRFDMLWFYEDPFFCIKIVTRFNETCYKTNKFMHHATHKHPTKLFENFVLLSTCRFGLQRHLPWMGSWKNIVGSMNTDDATYETSPQNFTELITK